RQIFCTLMARAQGAVDDPGAVADEDDGKLLVADIHLDLFEYAHGDEGAQAVDDGAEASLGETGGDAHHVLLGHAGVDVLLRTDLAELVEERIAVITGEEQHARVAAGGADQGGGEGVAHGLPFQFSSARAAANVSLFSRV